MFKTLLPRATRAAPLSRASHLGPSNLRLSPAFQIISYNLQRRRGYASEASDYDIVFIGGGVAGYVGAIKAGQAGLKVQIIDHFTLRIGC
jgi:dihydrolipoamide dehydrogenase